MVHAPSAASSSWSDSPLLPFFFVSSFPGIPRQRRCLSHISNYGRLPHSFPFSFFSVDKHTVKEHFISFPPITSFLLPSSHSFPGVSQTKMMSFPYIKLWPTPTFPSFTFLSVDEHTVQEHFISFPLITSFLLPFLHFLSSILNFHFLLSILDHPLIPSLTPFYPFLVVPRKGR